MLLKKTSCFPSAAIIGGLSSSFDREEGRFPLGIEGWCGIKNESALRIEVLTEIPLQKGRGRF